MYAHRSLYVTFGGTGPGVEQWQCGVKFGAYVSVGGGFADVGVDAAAAVDLAALVQPLKTMIGAADVFWPGDVYASWIKAVVLDQVGEYAAEARDITIAPPAAGPSSNRQAASTAWAVTLHSGSKFGHANYGRYYLPCLGLTRDQGSIGSTQSSVAAILARQATMLQAWQNVVSPAIVSAAGTTAADQGRLAIFSKKGNGTTKLVTQLRMGNVADTQRRRRNALRETYSTLGFNAPG